MTKQKKISKTFYEVSYLFSMAFCFFFAANMLAQEPSEEAIKHQFPDAKAVFLKQHETLEINYGVDKWNIQRHISEEMFYLENVGQMFSQKSIYYTSFEDIKDLKAYTKVPYAKGKKTLYNEVPVEKIDTKDVMMGGIFYSDHKEKVFTFPAVKEGAITSVSYTEETDEPRLLGAFFFSSYIPVLSSSFTVSVPENIEITYKVLGENTENIHFAEHKKGDIRHYTWTAKNLPKLEREDNAPSTSYYAPHVVVYIKSGTYADQTEEIITDVSGLYKWYNYLVTQTDNGEDTQLQKVVNGLMDGTETEEEKVKKIFQWVQSNIKYVAFEDGLGGFIPRGAGDVCTKKYGDCKDMSNILVKMLDIAGLKAYHTWIGSRDKPYSYYDVPTPIADNHMIAAIELNGEMVFLDATGEYLSFGYPTSMIQGKEALIGIDADNFKIIKVPIIPKEKNVLSETVEVSIEGKDLKGSADSKYIGYKKIFAEYARLRAEADGSSDKFFNAYLQKGTNKFEITKIEESGFYSRNDNIDLKYDFKIPDYVKKAGDKLYVNLNLNRKYSDQDIDLEKRKLDKERDFKQIERATYQLNIPDGYTVEYLPEASSFQDEEFGFDIRYEQKDNMITLHSEVYINHLMLKKSKFEEWNKMIDAISKAYQDVVVLKNMKDNG
ncbi:MAG: DUF3857 and transglutaminase domain-containing protein [Chitinophagales bacterium]